jgi:hypothetical protein
MQNNTYTVNVGPTTVLFIIFLVLKLTHVISWSWWWVFSPIWIPAALAVLFLAFGVILGAFFDR